MTDFDAFDRRLAGALRDYAADGPTLDDAPSFARAIALGNPRRSSWTAAPHGRATREVAWLVVAALLILASLLAIAGVGALRVPISPTLPSPEALQLPAGPHLPMPDELFGRYEAMVAEAGPGVPGGAYTLDVNGKTLLVGPDGEQLDWAGVGHAIEPTPGGGLNLLVSAVPPCGDGRYELDLDTGAGEDPPRPSASGGNPTPEPGQTMLGQIGDGAPFVLRPLSDACADRLRVLTSGPWEHPSVEIVAGQRYDSIDFTEPFSFVMPPSQAAIAPIEKSWGKGMLMLGNGYDWRGFFVDDAPVGADACQPARETLADIPETPADVEAWLRASSGLRVGDSIELQVDGRTALVIPIEALDCHDFEAPLTAGTFYLGSRIYAIPTDDDVILFTATSFGMPDLETVVDDLVRSIQFE